MGVGDLQLFHTSRGSTKLLNRDYEGECSLAY